MHILPEELKRPTKDRNSAEKAFKWINKTITAVQLGCLLLSIANVSIATNKTIDTDMWGINQGITITQGVVAKITNCTLSRSTTIGASTGTPTVMSLSNVYVYLAQLMFDLKAMIGVVAACIFLGAINKLLFDFNTYRLTYGEIIFRKDVISTLDVGFHIFGIVLVAGTATSASDLKAYFDACGVVGQNTLPYTPPFPELYVALVLGLFGNIVCATAHLIVSQRKVVEDSAPQDTVSYPETFAAPQPQQQILPRRANQAPPQRATYAPDRYTSGDDELRTLGATQQGLYSANGSPRRNLRAPPSTGSNRGRDQSSY